MAIDITVALLSGQSVSLSFSPDSLLVEVKVAAQRVFQIGFCRLVSANGQLLDPESTVRYLGEDTHTSLPSKHQ